MHQCQTTVKRVLYDVPYKKFIDSILFLSVTEICPAKAGSAYSILENMREST